MTPATNSAYTAATTAASVGVNTPIRRPTRIITGSNKAQPALRNAATTSARVLRGGGSNFSRRVSHHQVIHRPAASTMPGKIPARNNLLIETLAATPKITKPMDGGMIGPITPQAAIRPPLRALSCPALTIMGSSSAVSAAASATAEPDKADSKHAAMMVT